MLEVLLKKSSDCHPRLRALLFATNAVSSSKNRQEAGFIGDPWLRRLNFISSPVRKPGVAAIGATAGFLTRLLKGLNTRKNGSPIILVSDQNFEDDTKKSRTAVRLRGDDN